MRPRLPLPALAIAAVLCVPPAAQAQVVNTPEGSVEFIGLHRWTIDMIRHSMRVHVPGKPLGQCAAVLHQLGFPSAQSLSWGMVDGRPATLVILVEPQDAGRVRLRPASRATLPPVAEWATGYQLLRDRPTGFETAVGFFRVHLTRDTALTRAVLSLAGGDSAAVRATWAFLDGRRSRRDARLARERLLGDASLATRRIAAAILDEHAADDRTWYTLVEALTDSDEQAAAAEVALRALAEGQPRRIDWQPAEKALSALLDGTNALALRTTMDALARTRVGPLLGRRLLAGGGDLPLGLLASRSPEHRAAAHAFLVQVAGRDLGHNPEPWRRWIASLH